MSTKKQRYEFFKQATSLIQNLGGRTPTEDEDSLSYTWVLETSCGLLFLRVEDADYKRSIGTVFTRFDDPERASAWADAEAGLPDCSKVGKWNHHYFDKHWRDVEHAIDNLTYNLQQVCKGD